VRLELGLALGLELVLVLGLELEPGQELVPHIRQQ